MSNKLYRIFEEVEVRAKLLAKYWDNFYTEISQHLPESYQPEMHELSRQLEQALEQVVYELRNPTLTLATTGTTSSGKSTLVNLLCGAEIVPVAVSEMSAGAVTIEYSEEKSLVIHETPGAVWECGEWRDINEEEIYQRLYQAMISYIDNREKNLNLACPQSVITYPFRLLKDAKLDLPQGTTVRIMDLPGLSYVGDEGNASIIRQCREALCIVTYNSAETDPKRVNNLLQEVVQQVKELGGSPARMLFVLNRIDVFRADRNWTETESRFVANAVSNIKAELTEHLREYSNEIEDLQVVKLSSWPALLTLQIRSPNNTFSAEACRKADNHFNGLIEDILEDLPRSTQRWSSHDRNRVAEALWQRSYAEEFHQNLRKHIAANFPKLVIPQIIERFDICAGNSIAEWAKHTTTAILNSSQKNYQQECEKIKQIRIALNHFLDTSHTELRSPFEEIDAKIKEALAEPFKEDLVTSFQEQVYDLIENEHYKSYDPLGEKLYPLYGWREALGKAMHQVLGSVASSLETGKVDLEDTNLKRANQLNINLLERNLKRLINLGYTGSTAKEGKTVEARTEEEKGNLKQLNDELNELAIHLSIVMEDVLNQIANQELNRMYQAVEDLFNFQISYVEQGSINIAPDVAIVFPKSQLNKVDTQPKVSIRFQAGFEVTKGTWQQRKNLSFFEFILRFGKPKYESLSSDNTKIPGVEELLIGWINQAQEGESEITKLILKWLLEQIDCLKKNNESKAECYY